MVENTSTLLFKEVLVSLCEDSNGQDLNTLTSNRLLLGNIEITYVINTKIVGFIVRCDSELNS